jgi:hypothetical protein
MAEEFHVLPTRVSEDTSLTKGLARNTIFNLVGWAWPVALVILSVPYIVTKGRGNWQAE